MIDSKGMVVLRKKMFPERLLAVRVVNNQAFFGLSNEGIVSNGREAKLDINECVIEEFQRRKKLSQPSNRTLDRNREAMFNVEKGGCEERFGGVLNFN